MELHLPIDLADPVVPSLAALSFPAGRFEREMHDLYGIIPRDHPLPRRLVRHDHWPRGWYPMRRDAGPPPEFGEEQPFPFLTVEGPGVYEIPVGPIHAGLIEPGHFRFSVVGETILKLKARLWYVHRGVERLFAGREVADGIPLAERISGDTAVGHTPGVLPGGRGRARPGGAVARRGGPGRCCWSWSGSTTTSETSARCATTSATASCTPTRCGSGSGCSGSTRR